MQKQFRHIFLFVLNASKIIFGKFNKIIIPSESKPANEERRTTYIFVKIDPSSGFAIAINYKINNQCCCEKKIIEQC